MLYLFLSDFLRLGLVEVYGRVVGAASRRHVLRSYALFLVRKRTIYSYGRFRSDDVPLSRIRLTPRSGAKIDFLTTYLCYEKFHCSKPPLPQAASLFHFIPLPGIV